jgi:hypothetical protein
MNKQTPPSPEVWGKFTIQPSRKVVADTNIFLLTKKGLMDFIKEVESLKEHITQSWSTYPSYCVEILKKNDLAYTYCQDILEYAKEDILTAATENGTPYDTFSKSICSFYVSKIGFTCTCPSPFYWVMIYELAQLVYKYSSYRLRSSLSDLRYLIDDGNRMFVYAGSKETRPDEIVVPIIGSDWIRDVLNREIHFLSNTYVITQKQFEYFLDKGVSVPYHVRVETEMGLFHVGLINHKSDYSSSFKLNDGRTVTVRFDGYSYEDFKNRKPFSINRISIGKSCFETKNRPYVNMHLYNLLKASPEVEREVSPDKSRVCPDKFKLWNFNLGEISLVQNSASSEEKAFNEEIERIKKSSNYTPDMEYCTRVETAITNSMLLFYPNPMYESYHLVPEKKFFRFWKKYFSEKHLRMFRTRGKEEHMILTKNHVKRTEEGVSYIRLSSYQRCIKDYLAGRFILPSEEVTELHIEGDDLKGDDHFTFERENDSLEVISKETFNKLMGANPQLKSIKITITLPRK